MIACHPFPDLPQRTECPGWRAGADAASLIGDGESVGIGSSALAYWMRAATLLRQS